MSQQIITEYTEKRNELLAESAALRDRYKSAKRRLDALQTVTLTSSGSERANLQVEIEATGVIITEIERELDNIAQQLQQVQQDFVAAIDKTFRNGSASKSAKAAVADESVSVTLMAELLSSSIDVGHQLARLSERLSAIYAEQERQAERLNVAERERAQHAARIDALFNRTSLETLYGMAVALAALLLAAYLWAIKEIRDGVLVPRAVTFSFTIAAILVSVYILYNLFSRNWKMPQ